MARVSKAERTPNGSLPSGGALLNLNELRNRQSKELMTIAKKLDIDEVPRMSKQDLIYAVLRAQSANEGLIIAEGVLEILSEGYGFLRSPKYSYLPGPDDIYVSKSQIRSFSLRTGDTIGGQVRLPRDGEKNLALLKILIQLSKEQWPILIDQPEDALDNRSVFTELVSFLKNKKKS